MLAGGRKYADLRRRSSTAQAALRRQIWIFFSAYMEGVRRTKSLLACSRSQRTRGRGFADSSRRCLFVELGWMGTTAPRNVCPRGVGQPGSVDLAEATTPSEALRIGPGERVTCLHGSNAR